jgi:hypothetical protein
MMGRALPAALIVLILSPSFADDSGWHKSVLPHFSIFTQSARKPANFDLNMGRIHQQLSFDLSIFSPWMAKDNISVYLYRDPQAYAEGEFHPPAWSNGLALYDKRILLVYRQPGDPKTADKRLMEVIAHESTHLYFESYWAELGKMPPVWLNEGLAMVEEKGSMGRAEASVWYQNMLTLPQKRFPLDKFFTLAPATDLADEKYKPEVLIFYAQSYSLVFYMLHQYPHSSFKIFNDELRGGATVEQAVAKAYHIPTLDKFQSAWMTWLQEPSQKSRVDAALRAEEHADAMGPQIQHGFQTHWH